METTKKYVGEAAQRGDLVGKAFFEVLAETGFMGDGDADVLVEVESVDLGPVDSFLADQLFKHGELAGSRRQDDAGLAVGFDGCPDGGGADAGGFASEDRWIFINSKLHGVLLSNMMEKL